MRQLRQAHCSEMPAEGSLKLQADGELEITTGSCPGAQIGMDLTARYIASTFVLVLNWWVEGDSSLAPADVNAPFRGLVLPTLTRILNQGRAE